MLNGFLLPETVAVDLRPSRILVFEPRILEMNFAPVRLPGEQINMHVSVRGVRVNGGNRLCQGEVFLQIFPRHSERLSGFNHSLEAQVGPVMRPAFSLRRPHSRPIKLGFFHPPAVSENPKSYLGVRFSLLEFVWYVVKIERRDVRLCGGFPRDIARVIAARSRASDRETKRHAALPASFFAHLFALLSRPENPLRNSGSVVIKV